MKILLVDQYGDLGGGQRCLLEAAAGFHERNWQVYAAVPNAGPLSAQLAPHCAEIFPLPCGQLTPTRKSTADALRFAVLFPKQVATLHRIIKDHSIDAVYVNGSQVLPGAALARSGRPLIFHVHWVVTQPLAAALAREAARWSNAFVVATSENVARSVQTFIPRERIRVVYNGVEGNDTRRSAQGNHVAIIGRIAPEKGQLEFAQAARLLSADLHFSVIGAPMFTSDGYFERVRRAAEGSSISFPGWTNNIAESLSQIDLLVVPSSQTDNIPRVILEAFAAGTPVLAFPSGGIPELIQNGETGFLVSDRTPAALAQAISEAMKLPARVAEIAARARQRWAQHYTLQRYQSDLCATVEEAVRLHSRTPSRSTGTNAAA